VPDVLDRFGRIDILANVAGLAVRATLFDADPDQWDRVYGVNVKAPFFLLQGVARHMVERGGGGKIVNVSSSSAFRSGGEIVYASSKAAVAQLTRSAAAVLGPYDINVNTVAPGVTVTAMIASSPILGSEEAVQHQVSEGPLRNLLARASKPEDVAAAIVFLCLPASRQVTGQVLHTSAGLVV